VKASYKCLQIINGDLALVKNHRSKITLSKLIAIGCRILKIVKLVMCEFYSDCLLHKFRDRLHLCFTNMDSFFAGYLIGWTHHISN